MNKMRIIILITAFTCLWQANLAAQNKVTLSGTVKTSGGEPLAMAIVAVEKNTAGVYTDGDGRYRLELIPGKHTVRISSFGYNTLTAEVNVTGNQVKDFVMNENSITLHTVEVYGKSQAQQAREGVFAVNALDVKPLISSITNLNTMVNRTTGIRIREEGGVGSDFELSINGMSGNSVRYFIDGVPLSAKGSGVSLGNLPVNIIDRIEIYKGVVPAYLGVDALGGAINIITRRDKKDYLDASYGVGSFHTHKFDLNGRYVIKNTGIIIKPSVGINYSKNNYTMKGVELWDDNAGGDGEFVLVNRKRFHDDYLSLLAQIEAGVTNKRWADDFFVSLAYSSVDKDLQTGSTQKRVYGEAKREEDAWSLSVQYRKKDFLLPKLQLNAFASYTWDHSLTTDTAYRQYRWDGSYIHSSRNEITGRGKSLRHYKRPLTVTRANLDYVLNSHHSFNLNYMLNRTGNKRYDDIDTDFEPSNDILAKHIIGLSYNQSFLNGRMNNSFFVKDYINYLKVSQQDLYWITGSQDELGSSTTNNTGYGAGMRFHFFRELALKASYEHSTRLPMARELLGNGTTVYPNFKLKPETSHNLNLGMFGALHPFGRHHIYYEVNAFYRDTKDYIYAVIEESTGMSQYDNVASVRIKGIEGEIKYMYGNVLQLIANCSYQDARSRTKYYADGSPMITYDNKIPNRPWLFSNAELSLNRHNLFAKGNTLRFRYNLEYIHWFYLTWEGYGSLESKSRIPTQVVSNATLSYSLRNDRYNVSLECNNLLDRTVYDNFMLQKPGRSFFCKFRLFIN